MKGLICTQVFKTRQFESYNNVFPDDSAPKHFNLNKIQKRLTESKKPKQLWTKAHWITRKPQREVVVVLPRTF